MRAVPCPGLTCEAVAGGRESADEDENCALVSVASSAHALLCDVLRCLALTLRTAGCHLPPHEVCGLCSIRCFWLNLRWAGLSMAGEQRGRVCAALVQAAACLAL